MIDFKRMRWLILKAPKMDLKLLEAQTRACNATVTLSDMPCGGSSGDKLERDVIRIIEVKTAYAEITDELERMRELLRPLVDDLEDPDERAVMRLRYMMGYSPQKIADCEMVPLSLRSVFRYLKRAERHING